MSHSFQWRDLTLSLLFLIVAMQSYVMWILIRQIHKLAIVLKAIGEVQLDLWRLQAWR